MRDRTVGLLVSVELLMSLGFGATATTLGWQGYSRAHDPLVLGLIGLAEFIPAVAVLMSAMQAAMIAGPAVAGLLQVVGPPVPYAFAAVCAVLAMVMVMLVPKAIGRAHVAEQEASLSDALAGVRFIFDTPALL